MRLKHKLITILLAIPVFLITAIVVRAVYVGKYIGSPKNDSGLEISFTGKQLHETINDFRKLMKLNVLSWDEEVCSVANKIIKEGWWQSDYKITNYEDLCKTCINLAYVEAQDSVSASRVLDMWKSDKLTSSILYKENVTLGCGVVEGSKVIYVMVKKDKGGMGSVKKSVNISCTGPDNKTFQTTQEECDKFNSAWGKKPYQAPKQTQYGGNGLVSYSCEINGKVYILKVKSENDGLYYCNDNKRLISELKTSMSKSDADLTASLQKLKDDLNAKLSVTYTPGPTIAPITYEALPELSVASSRECTYYGMNEYGVPFNVCTCKDQFGKPISCDGYNPNN